VKVNKKNPYNALAHPEEVLGMQMQLTNHYRTLSQMKKRGQLHSLDATLPHKRFLLHSKLGNE